MAASWQTLIFLASVLCTATLHQVDGKKVLILTVQMGGHTGEFGTIARELMKLGEYEIHAVMDENIATPPQLKVPGLKILHYKSPDKAAVDIKTFDREVTRMVFESRDMTPVYEFSVPRLTLDCRLLLQDQELFKKIEAERYDVALVDSMIYCYSLIPYRLGIPMIAVSSYRWPQITRTFPLSVMASCAAPPKNLFERIQAISEARMLDLVPSTEIDETEFLDYLPGKRLSSLQEVADKTDMWILVEGNVLDCPKPTRPNVISVGGLNTRPSKPLTGSILEFVAGAKDGVIVVSFGSMMSSQPKRFLEKFAKAFKQVPQRVIWRVQKEAAVGLEVSENVKIVDWLPQNDILGHKNTRLFITHCGNNGQWESFYHTVPMIGMPVWGDQFPNADRLLHHDIGLKLDLWEFTPDELVASIREVIGNDKYKKNIQRLVEIFKNLPEHPSKTAAFWIDHVVKYGADHLKSPAFDMPIYEFYMLDLFAFITGVFMVALLFLWCLVKYFVKRCLTDEHEKTKKKMH